jgi:hypothetical protein
LKDFADIRFPRVKIILLVQDNLNFHSAASLTRLSRVPKRDGWSSASPPNA